MEMPFSNGIIGKTIIYTSSDEEIAALVIDKIIVDGYTRGSRTKYLVMDSDFNVKRIETDVIKRIVITTEFEKIEDEL